MQNYCTQLLYTCKLDDTYIFIYNYKTRIVIWRSGNTSKSASFSCCILHSKMPQNFGIFEQLYFSCENSKVDTKHCANVISLHIKKQHFPIPIHIFRNTQQLMPADLHQERTSPMNQRVVAIVAEVQFSNIYDIALRVCATFNLVLDIQFYRKVVYVLSMQKSSLEFWNFGYRSFFGA